MESFPGIEKAAETITAKADQQRLVFCWMPTVGFKPDVIKVEFEVLSKQRAKMIYKESFKNIPPEAVGPLFAATKRSVITILGDIGEIKFDTEKAEVTFEAEGEIRPFAAWILSEFMVQYVQKNNPEEEFWTLVEGMQTIFSTTRFPIARIYEDYTGRPLHSGKVGGTAQPTILPSTTTTVKCGKCDFVAPFTSSGEAEGTPFTCRHCGHEGKLTNLGMF